MVLARHRSARRERVRVNGGARGGDSVAYATPVHWCTPARCSAFAPVGVSAGTGTVTVTVIVNREQS